MAISIFDIIATLSIMAPSIMTPSIMDLIAAFSIMNLIVTLSIMILS